MASISPMPSTSAGQTDLTLSSMTTKDFKRLLDSQSLVDVTLACDGGQISAHKVVLSACSSYLHKILKTHPVKHPIIILAELNIVDIKILVNYMYTGELLTTQAPSPSLLRTAAVLNINSLKDFLNESSTSNSPSSSSPNPLTNATTTTTTNASTTTSLKNEHQFTLDALKKSLNGGNILDDDDFADDDLDDAGLDERDERDDGDNDPDDVDGLEEEERKDQNLQQNNNISNNNHQDHNNSHDQKVPNSLQLLQQRIYPGKQPKLELQPKSKNHKQSTSSSKGSNSTVRKNSNNQNHFPNQNHSCKNNGTSSLTNINNLNISNLDEFLGTTGNTFNHLEDDDFDDDDDDLYNQDALMDESSELHLDDYSREDDMVMANQYNLSNNPARNHKLPPTKNRTHLDMQFRCPVCEQDFYTICSFEYHMQRNHFVSSFGCEICDKPFASLRYVLTDHMRRCHGWLAEQEV